MIVVSPGDAASLPRWVGWRHESRNGRPTKVPFTPNGSGMAKADDPDTWDVRSRAEAWAARFVNGAGGGVGLQLGILAERPDTALGGVDLDACHDPVTGEIKPWAREVIARLGTTAEVSPSGTGAKAFFTYDAAALPALREAMGTRHGRSFKRGGGDHPEAIELHIGNRYFAVTDRHLDGTPADMRPVPLAALLWLIRDAGPAFAAGCPANGPSGADQGPGQDARDDDAVMDRVRAAMDGDGALAQRWAGDTSGFKDGSRSGLAFALGAAIKRHGFDFAEMRDLLRRNPHTADWTAGKGEADGARELRRIWDKAGTDTRGYADWPPAQLDLATADPVPPPAFDLTLFPAPWTGWITRTAEGAGAPRDYVGCALLGVAGAAIGNSRWGSPWEGWQHPPVVNIACIGLPSAGKSPAIHAVAEPLAALAGELNDDFEERMRAHRGAVQEAKERRALWEADVKAAVKENRTPPAEPLGAAEPARPHKRRLCSTDPTVEAARDLSASNPRGLLLHRDELAGWIGSMDRYGKGGAGADRAFWLQSYDGGRWTSDRVKDGDDGRDVPHLTWGIVGGIQPDRLASILLSGDDDGLSARFIYTWPAPPSGVSDPPTGRSPPFALGAKLRRLRDLPIPDDGAPVILHFSPDAVNALQDWRRAVKRLERDATGLFLSWTGKLPGMAVRLAVVFAHLEWLARPDGTPSPVGVDVDAVARALGFLADYAVPMARRAFGEAALPEAERDARRLARWLRRQSPMPGTVNARALRRQADGPGISTSQRIEAALAELAELGWVRLAPARDGGGKGRQRADWAVNPGLQEDAS